jgi:hypothetical protein
VKTTTINLFAINELTENARQKAIKDFRYNTLEYFWITEFNNSLKAFCNVFDIDLGRFSADYVDYNTDWIKDEILDLKGLALFKYLQNNYLDEINKGIAGELTGYYTDCQVFHPLKEFMERPYDIDFKDIIEKCMKSWQKSLAAEIEYQNSDEYIIDHMTANEYLFTETGKWHN